MKKKTGLKGLEDNPETRQYALDKLGNNATGWFGYVSSGANPQYYFKGPKGQWAKGIGNAKKLFKASLEGEVVKKTGLKDLEDNQQTRKYALDELGANASGWFGYSDDTQKIYFKGPNGQKANSIAKAKELITTSNTDEAKMKSVLSVDMLEGVNSEIVELLCSIEADARRRSLSEEKQSSKEYRILQELQDRLVAKIDIVMRVLKSEVKNDEQALELMTNLSGAYKQLHSLSKKKLLGPKQVYESDDTYGIRSTDRSNSSGFAQNGGSHVYNLSLANDIRMLLSSLRPSLSDDIQETSTIKRMIQEVSNVEDKLAQATVTKDKIYEDNLEVQKLYSKEWHQERKESYEVASSTYYAAKENIHHDKENLAKLKNDTLDAYYKTGAGKKEQRKIAGSNTYQKSNVSKMLPNAKSDG